MISNREKIKSLSLSALLCSVALILSYLESLVPPFFPIPAIKVGLPNLVIIFALYKLGFGYAVTVSVLRVFLSSLLFGSLLSAAYGTAGALISLLIMFLLEKLNCFTAVGVSIAGGVSHNIAQTLLAMIIMNTNEIAYYLPFLLLSGVVAGALIGVGGAFIIKKINIKERFF